MRYVIVNMISVPWKTSGSKAKNRNFGCFSLNFPSLLFVAFSLVTVFAGIYFHSRLVGVRVLVLDLCALELLFTRDTAQIWRQSMPQNANFKMKFCVYLFERKHFANEYCIILVVRSLRVGESGWRLLYAFSVRVCHTSKNWEAYLS